MSLHIETRPFTLEEDLIAHAAVSLDDFVDSKKNPVKIKILYSNGEKNGKSIIKNNICF